jgi:alpha/beta superfamily hydrolase
MNPLIDSPADPIGVAVIAHPHPDYGGDMHNPGVTALHRGLVAAGFATVRYNFNGSATPHEDLAVATTQAMQRFVGLPLLRAGYSFGADAVLSSESANSIAEILVAPPLAVFGNGPYGIAAVPRLILVPEHDQFSDPARTTAQTASWPDTTIETLPTADHFLAGATTLVEELSTRFVRELKLSG